MKPLEALTAVHLRMRMMAAPQMLAQGLRIWSMER
jgi:hypothetical protein